jgi:hypothetical protein
MGHYAGAMTTFIQRQARNYSAMRSEFQRRRLTARAHFSLEHQRTTDAWAQLWAAYGVYIAFLLDLGAVDAKGSRALKERILAGLQEAGDLHAGYRSSGEPVTAFLRLLASAIGAGRAHLASPEGQAPPDREPGSGWRNDGDLPWKLGPSEWRSMGERVGWLDADDLYLDLDASYKSTQAMTALGETIEVTPTTLLRRLRDRHLLKSTEMGTRETLTVRRMLEGRRRSVVHLSAGVLGLPLYGKLDDEP